MQGNSRASLADARAQLDAATVALTAQPAGSASLALGDDLFAATAVLDSSATLRRALTDPGRSGSDRGGVVRQLFHGKVSPAAEELLAGLAASKWSVPRDVADAAELLAVGAVVISAEQAGVLGSLEDELFRFERTVEGSPALRDALADRRAAAAPKADLVSKLLQGKATAQTVRLARQAVLGPRGRRVAAALEAYLEAAAARREQAVAHAVVAAPLTAAQHDRLAAALSTTFNRPIQLNVDVDPEVVGGIRVSVGDEVIDGSIAGRLEEARRRLAG